MKPLALLLLLAFSSSLGAGPLQDFRERRGRRLARGTLVEQFFSGDLAIKLLRQPPSDWKLPSLRRMDNMMDPLRDRAGQAVDRLQQSREIPSEFKESLRSLLEMSRDFSLEYLADVYRRPSPPVKPPESLLLFSLRANWLRLTCDHILSGHGADLGGYPLPPPQIVGELLHQMATGGNQGEVGGLRLEQLGFLEEVGFFPGLGLPSFLAGIETDSLPELRRILEGRQDDPGPQLARALRERAEFMLPRLRKSPPVPNLGTALRRTRGPLSPGVPFLPASLLHELDFLQQLEKAERILDQVRSRIPAALQTLEEDRSLSPEVRRDLRGMVHELPEEADPVALVEEFRAPDLPPEVQERGQVVLHRTVAWSEALLDWVTRPGPLDLETLPQAPDPSLLDWARSALEDPRESGAPNSEPPPEPREGERPSLWPELQERYRDLARALRELPSETAPGTPAPDPTPEEPSVPLVSTPTPTPTVSTPPRPPPEPPTPPSPSDLQVAPPPTSLQPAPSPPPDLPPPRPTPPRPGRRWIPMLLSVLGVLVVCGTALVCVWMWRRGKADEVEAERIRSQAPAPRPLGPAALPESAPTLSPTPGGPAEERAPESSGGSAVPTRVSGSAPGATLLSGPSDPRQELATNATVVSHPGPQGAPAPSLGPGDGPGEALPPWLQATLESSLGTRYTRPSMLGAGGMGTVVKAFDSRLERVVAIKVPPPHLSSHPDFRTRFLREARALARLSHENIGRVYDVPDVAEGHVPVMILEFLDGSDLGEILVRQGLPPGRDVLRWILETGSGLQHAHEHGILHRDVKPSNLMLVGKRIKILDFGLASLEDRAGLTQSGMLLGSLPFMPPEQLRGEKVDHHADQYALAVTAFQLLSGRLPFAEDDVQRGQVPHLSRARSGIPPGLDATLARAMAPNPEQRFASMAEFMQTLHASLRG